MTQSLASWSMYSSCLRKLKTLMAVLFLKPYLFLFSLYGACPVSQAFVYLKCIDESITWTRCSSLTLFLCLREAPSLPPAPCFSPLDISHHVEDRLQAWAWLRSTRRGGPSSTRRASKTTLQIHKPTCSSLLPEARGSGVLHQIRSTKTRVAL